MKKLLMFLAILPISSVASAPVDLTNISTLGTMVLYEPGGKPVEYVTCNKVMVKPLMQALKCMKERNPDLLPMTYHGCYNPRVIAGTSRPSMHTYGRAIDLNVHIGTPERMALCFEEAGFVWGGRWKKNKHDPMHFELR